MSNDRKMKINSKKVIFSVYRASLYWKCKIGKGHTTWA